MAVHSDDATSASSAYSDRSCAPAETLRRIEPLLPAYGITRLARLTTLDNPGIPVWNAVMPNARSIVISQGKGITDLDAKVSAAMEALERAVAGRPRIPTRKASWRELTADGAMVETLDCLVAHSRDDLRPDDRIDWVPGVDLVAGRQTFVPFDAVILDGTATGPRFWQSSDGLASGNTIDEARLHGLLERIERDAYMLWQVASNISRRACCVDPLSLADSVVADLMERVTRAGLILRLFDITSDIGIPCYSALLAPSNILEMKQPRYLDVTHGSGAHPNPRRAAIRAITEAAQARLTFISGARDDIDPDTFGRLLPVETRELFSSVAAQVVPRNDPTVSGASELLAFTVERAKGAGITSLLSVTLTEETGPFAVVKILAPQLENPEGNRKRRFGARAISRTLEFL
jgi:ribosomal protein S12 methylthiotransferase accessory factor